MSASATPSKPARRHNRLVVIAGALAAIVALVGLGAIYAYAPGPSATNEVSAQRESNGLLLTLRVGPGPYFLRELVSVTVSLTNVSQTPIPLYGLEPGNPGVNRCASLFSVTQSGGQAPMYPAPSTGGMSCPPPEPTDLAPGQTQSASDVLPITASGHVSLSADVSAAKVTTVSSGGQSYTVYSNWDPFAGQQPTVSLSVSPKVPTGRTIWLPRIGTRVYIIAPVAAWQHLDYLYTVLTGGCDTGSFAWVPIQHLWVDDHPCAGQYGEWDYAVGAPGYAIATGRVGSASGG